jgi:hypothetical protein
VTSSNTHSILADASAIARSAPSTKSANDRGSSKRLFGEVVAAGAADAGTDDRLQRPPHVFAHDLDGGRSVRDLIRVEGPLSPR